MAVTGMANSSIRDFKKFNSVGAGFVALPDVINFLVVGGGGAGGAYVAGGGGAGGFVLSGIAGAPALPFSGSFTVTIGAGGGTSTGAVL